MPMSLLNYRDELIKTAEAIVADGKGILAADESTGTIGKRFLAINVENVEANRQAYRELLFTCAGKVVLMIHVKDKLQKYIGGVILYEETLNQSTATGIPFPKLLADNGIAVGIKVDKVHTLSFDVVGNGQSSWNQRRNYDSRLGWTR